MVVGLYTAMHRNDYIAPVQEATAFQKRRVDFFFNICTKRKKKLNPIPSFNLDGTNPDQINPDLNRTPDQIKSKYQSTHNESRSTTSNQSRSNRNPDQIKNKHHSNHDPGRIKIPIE